MEIEYCGYRVPRKTVKNLLQRRNDPYLVESIFRRVYEKGGDRSGEDNRDFDGKILLESYDADF